MSNSRYQAYLAVEGGWFNELPAHWQKLPSNRVFEQRREAAKEDDEQLSATQKYGVLPQSLFMALDDRKVTLALAGTDNFKHVDEGNFVISLRSFEGGIELSNYSGCVSPAYTCLKARKPIANDYYKFALKCGDYILALQSVTQGIRDGKNISYGEFSKLSVPYPPLEEQLAIATFLDRETAKIDALIAEQQRLIELLQEKRQAVISHAVTKGLNPDVPMKDSGVEWLGEVPEHWDVRKISQLFVGVGSGTTPKSDEIEYYEDGDIPWVVTGDLNDEFLEICSNFITRKAMQAHTTLRLYPKGSVAVAMYGATIGKAALLGLEATVNQACCVLPPSVKVNANFLLHFIISARNHLISLATGGGQPNINQDIVRSLRIPIPEVDEQIEIVEHLSKILIELEGLIGLSDRQVLLLQERRSALISAAVTGQIDVRGLVPDGEAA